MDGAGDAGGAVYPEVRVAHSAPGARPSPAHTGNILAVEQQPVAPLVTRANVESMRRSGVSGGNLRRVIQLPGLIGVRGVHRLPLQDLAAFEHTVAEQHALEPEVIARCGVQAMPTRPPGRLLVENLPDDGPPPVVATPVYRY